MTEGAFSMGEVAAGAGLLLTVVYSMAKVTVTKTLTKIEQIADSLSTLTNAVTALQVKVEELKGIKDDIRDVEKNNHEAMLRIADLKTDIKFAHDGLREIKKGLR